MPTKMILTITSGIMRGKKFTFEEHDTFLLGRMDDCHICLPDDPCVSRHHFIIEVNPPDARIRDLGSLNGTFVNDKKFGSREKHETPEGAAQRQYPEVDLQDGDSIKVGDTVMLLNIEAELVCVECHKEISEDAREKCRWIGGTYICDICRQKVMDAENPQPSTPRPVRCQKCGRDVSSEIGSGRHGDYICKVCRQQAQEDPMALLKGLIQGSRKTDIRKLDIPEYEIVNELGVGGFGVVYLVRHKKHGTMAALKVMLSNVAVDERARQAFLREIENMRRLRHQHIITFLDYGSVGGVFYILLEYCEGGNLGDLMSRHGGKLGLDEAGPIMLQVMEGLAYAHKKGFVHRDLKPQNILLTGKVIPLTAKIADMGLAKNFAQAGLSGMTATGSFAGSFPFMPREQVTNFKFVKPVSDIWSIGATFYNMLTDQFPRDFHRGQDPMEVILQGKIVPLQKRLPTIPKPVAEVIDCALANKTGDRYQDAGEMCKALNKVL
jgi:pSer/pThr/pTyr-binding forkhead associated (FHA) protein